MNRSKTQNAEANSGDLSPDEDQLAAAMEEYLLLCEREEHPDREAFVDRFPEVAAELSACLEGLEFVEEVAPQIKTTNHESSTTHGRVSLGDFQILNELGRGGMGVVYRARQLSLDREVALKVLPFGAMLDQRRLQRFKNEARAVAGMKHPGIVSVIDVGCERGVHYYAMELVEGCSVADLISALHGKSDYGEVCDASPLDEIATIAHLSTQKSRDRRSFYRSIATLGLEAANALLYAHDSGVVHRDIKPSNLMFDQMGHVLITDFGLAAIHGGTELTMSGDILGTLRYMSPEQASGRRGAVDHRSDIFSLGSTMYELATGESALRGSDRQQFLLQLDRFEAIAPRKHVADMPRDFETILLKTLRPDPWDRYDSAAQLADDLQRFLDTKPIQARRSRPTDVLWRWTQRNPMVAMLTAVIALLVSIAAIVGSLVAIQQQIVAEERRRELYDADIKQSYEHLERAEYTQAESLLSKYKLEDTDIDDLRGWEWQLLWNRCRRFHQAYAHRHGIQVTRLAYSPTGATYARSLYTGGFAVRDAKTHEKLWPTKSHGPEIADVAYTFDGQVLVTTGEDRRVLFSDVVTGMDVLPPIEELELPSRKVAVSKHGIVAVGQKGSRGAPAKKIGIWKLQRSGEHLRCDSLPPLEMVGTVRGLTFSIDGRLLAAGGTTGQIRVWETESWRVVADFDAQVGGIHSAAFSPDGTILAVGGGLYQDGWNGNGDLTLWRVSRDANDSSFTLAGRLVKHDSPVEGIVFSPDGQRIYSAGDSAGKVHTWSAETFHFLGSIHQHAGKVNALSISPDGKSLLSGGEDNQVVQTPLDRSEPVEFIPQKTRYSVLDVEFTRDGKFLYSCSSDGTIKKMQLSSGEVVAQATHDLEVNSLNLSRDETKLAIACHRWTQSAKRSRLAELKLVDAANLKLISKQDTGVTYVRSAAFSPDDQFVACVGNVLGVWDLDSNTYDEKPLPGGGYRIEFSPDQKLLALSAKLKEDDAIRLFAFPSLEPAGGFLQGEDVWAVAFSPRGPLVATGGGITGTIFLWDILSRKRVGELTGHNSSVTDLSFSPDGTRLVSGSMDGNVILWNVKTKNDLITFRSRAGWVWRVKFSPNGRTIAATYRGGDDPPGIRIWSL